MRKVPFGLSGALARRGFVPVHDRGRVVTDLAVAIADGAATMKENAAGRGTGAPRRDSRAAAPRLAHQKTKIACREHRKEDPM